MAYPHDAFVIDRKRATRASRSRKPGVNRSSGSKVIAIGSWRGRRKNWLEPILQPALAQLSLILIERRDQQENKEMREVAKRTEAQISHLTDLMTKFANQMLPSTSTPPPPPNPSPLPSQPLPNPKGGINVVERVDEKKEKKDARTEWLVELIAKANAMVESDDEDWWDESEESDESDEEDSEDEEEEWEVEEESRVEVEVEKEDVTKEVVEEEQVKEASKEEVEIVEEYGSFA
ncbi:hypothetical protein PIB30_087155 [Stylosanthes scabra]|uniref:Uncharacterized protein n=1 Tax=Stylosanthes scabra TaxID=79078 RepID=A0ABU6TU27_9FABA|nr:hypothetical protein [Stylosanthes scabra]